MTGKGFLFISGGLLLAYWVGYQKGLNVTENNPTEPLPPQTPQQTSNKSLPVNIPPQYQNKRASNCTQI